MSPIKAGEEQSLTKAACSPCPLQFQHRRVAGRGAAPISSPQEGQIPQASRWALELGPESACLSLAPRKLRVSHELLAKREDGVKRLLLLKGQA
jgi:hypothetical protein